MIFETLLFKKHLERGEKVLLAIHRHWILLLKPGLITGFFGLLMPWVLYAIGFNTALFFWIAVVWSGSAYLLFMIRVFRWHGNAVLLTSQGVLQVQWDGFFNNQATRVTWSDIEGAAYQIRGFWGTLLRYGDFTLRLLTGNHFTVLFCSRPKEMELKVAALQEQFLEEKNRKDIAGLRNLLSEIAAQHWRQK